ncbi:MAG: hypothetical protein Q9168_002803 [Polycauliona sp. 1 TL-2023]
MSEANSDHGSESDASFAQNDFLRKIGLAASTSQAAFCCAGQVPVTPDLSLRKVKDEVADLQLTSSPVVIRWDRKDGNTISKITLPVVGEHGRRNHAAIQDLLNDCASASFGKDGEDILDDSYRKAIKLDADQFSTNFSPYDVGIIGAISQTLLPGVAKPMIDKEKKHYIHAECLGVVAELGEEVIYNWGTGDDIEWAAFYSDCEHEVHEVTAGHRITLTYNLYAHEQLGGVSRNPSTIGTDTFALYHRIKEALASSEFFPQGGTLGFHCVHAYAHANDRVVKPLPNALKGADAVIYSIFKALGVPVNMRAVMEGQYEDLKEGYYYDDSVDGMDDGKDGAKLVSTALDGIQITDYGGNESTDAVEPAMSSPTQPQFVDPFQRRTPVKLSPLKSERPEPLYNPSAWRFDEKPNGDKGSTFTPRKRRNAVDQIEFAAQLAASTVIPALVAHEEVRKRNGGK